MKQALCINSKPYSSSAPGTFLIEGKVYPILKEKDILIKIELQMDKTIPQWYNKDRFIIGE